MPGQQQSHHLVAGLLISELWLTAEQVQDSWLAGWLTGALPYKIINDLLEFGLGPAYAPGGGQRRTQQHNTTGSHGEPEAGEHVGQRVRDLRRRAVQISAEQRRTHPIERQRRHLVDEIDFATV